MQRLNPIRRVMFATADSIEYTGEPTIIRSEGASKVAAIRKHNWENKWVAWRREKIFGDTVRLEFYTEQEVRVWALLPYDKAMIIWRRTPKCKD